MAVPEKYLASFIPGGFYHIYNRTNNKEKLFRENKDKFLFLEKFEEYLFPYVRIYAFCLLDDHFHFIVSVREQSEIVAYVNTIEKEDLTLKEEYLMRNLEEDLWLNYFIEWQFLRFFTSYAMYFNRSYGRKGQLFHRPFKRVKIEGEEQFLQAIIYVHHNPVKHRLVQKLEDYVWSSFNKILSGGSSFLESEYVLKLFGGKELFVKIHQSQNKNFDDHSFYMEE